MDGLSVEGLIEARHASRSGAVPGMDADIKVYCAAIELGAALAAAAAPSGIWIAASGVRRWSSVWSAEVKTAPVAVGVADPFEFERGSPFLRCVTVLLRPFEAPGEVLAAPTKSPFDVNVTGEAGEGGRRLEVAFGALHALGVRVAAKLERKHVSLISGRAVSCRVDLLERPGAIILMPDESATLCAWRPASMLTVTA